MATAQTARTMPRETTSSSVLRPSVRLDETRRDRVGTTRERMVFSVWDRR
jgi:hypothetical protein